MTATVEMTPFVADQPVEIEPSRAAQVPGVAHQLRAIEDFTKKLLAKGDRLRLVGAVETVRFEDVFRRLDDERRGVFIEFVDVRLEPAMLGAAEIEGERVVELFAAEPDETVRSHHEVGLERVGITIAD